MVVFGIMLEKKNYVIMLTITIMIGIAPIFYDSKVLITLKMS